MDFDDKMIDAYDAEKRRYYHELVRRNPEKFGQYLRGWLLRCDRVRRQLEAYYENEIVAAGSAYSDEHGDV